MVMPQDTGMIRIERELIEVDARLYRRWRKLARQNTALDRQSGAVQLALLRILGAPSDQLTNGNSVAHQSDWPPDIGTEFG